MGIEMAVFTSVQFKWNTWTCCLEICIKTDLFTYHNTKTRGYKRRVIPFPLIVVIKSIRKAICNFFQIKNQRNSSQNSTFSRKFHTMQTLRWGMSPFAQVQCIKSTTSTLFVEDHYKQLYHSCSYQVTLTRFYRVKQWTLHNLCSDCHHYPSIHVSMDRILFCAAAPRNCCCHQSFPQSKELTFDKFCCFGILKSLE